MSHLLMELYYYYALYTLLLNDKKKIILHKTADKYYIVVYLGTLFDNLYLENKLFLQYAVKVSTVTRVDRK